MTPVLIEHLISGNSLFSGIGLVLFSAIYRSCRWPFHARLVTPMTLLGGALILFSSTPFPTLVSIGLAALTSWWLVTTPPRRMGRVDAKRTPPEPVRYQPATLSQKRLTAILTMAWIAAGTAETCWRQLPHVPLTASRRIVVLADSITAGLDEDEVVTWPRLLHQEHHVEVIDFSRVGDTVGSSLSRIRNIDLPEGVVLIELGGNDILGTTTIPEFREQLELLLQHAATTSDRLLMFEIPLPPLGHRFGQIQRELAGKYGVQLIPKRILASVLISPETTLDSVHLTQAGHSQMAKIIWQIVRPDQE